MTLQNETNTPQTALKHVQIDLPDAAQAQLSSRHWGMPCRCYREYHKMSGINPCESQRILKYGHLMLMFYVKWLN